MGHKKGDWGRRQSDNQAYPKHKPDKSELPTGLEVVLGTTRRERIFKIEPFGSLSDELVDVAEKYGGNVDTTAESSTASCITIWKYADFDDMDSANAFAKQARSYGVWSVVKGDNSVWLVSETDPKLGWWGGKGTQPKQGSLGETVWQRSQVGADEACEEPETSSWEEDRYAGTHGLDKREPEHLHGSMELADLKALAPDRVPDRTYLYRIPFRTVGANRATDNLKVRATTKQNALGEANEILAQRYPGGKFIIRSKSVRRLTE